MRHGPRRGPVLVIIDDPLHPARGPLDSEITFDGQRFAVIPRQGPVPPPCPPASRLAPDSMSSWLWALLLAGGELRAIDGTSQPAETDADGSFPETRRSGSAHPAPSDPDTA